MSLYRLSLACLLIFAGAASARDYTYSDAHLHYVDFFQETAGMAKLLAARAAWSNADAALQIHGGYGYLSDFPVERYCRDVRVTKIYEGTSNIQKLIIARNL